MRRLQATHSLWIAATHPSNHNASNTQGLEDEAKVQQCLRVAYRGLSDLEAYAAAARADNPSISLKGATH